MARKSRKKGAVEAAAKRKPSARAWRCAVYCRLSVQDNGGEDGTSIEAQEAVVREALSRMRDVEVAGVYRDNGYTGTDFGNRPGFAGMMADIRDGKIDCIAVKDLSRFGRNYLEAGYYIERILPYLGVRFIAVADGVDTLDSSARDKVLVPVKNLVNEIHSRDIGRKGREAYMARARAGTASVTRAPYGYAKDPDDRSHLVVVPEEAGIVRRIFGEYLSGCGGSEIARGLDADGIPTPSASRGLPNAAGSWSDTTISHILRDPVYIGHMVNHKVDGSIFSTGPSIVPEEERIVHEGAHEAIVDDATFEAARRIRAARGGAWIEAVDAGTDMRAALPDVFSDVGVTCSGCGGRMKIERQLKGRELAGVWYACPSCRGKGSGRVAEPLLRMVVGDEVARQVQLRSRFEEARAEAASSGASARELGRARRALEASRLYERDVEAARRRVYEDWCTGQMGDAEWDRAQESIGGKLADARSRTARLAAELAELEALFAPPGDAELPAGRVRLTREAVDALVSSVAVSPDGCITVTFAFGDFDERLGRLEGLK